MSSIRPATRNDYEGIARLIKSEEELFLVYPAGTFPFTVSQVEHLAKTRDALTVMIDDGRVIGFANLYDHQQGVSAFIGNVVIDADYRGEGLGKQMVCYMLEMAFNKYQLPEVHISVFNNNMPALTLYRNLGFRQYDVEERVDPGGLPVSLIHMFLPRNSQQLGFKAT